jgi:hypothetical protein
VPTAGAWVIVKKIDRSWSIDTGYYLPPGTCADHYFGEWLRRATDERAWTPLLGFYNNRIDLTDGRHRFGWCRDHGVAAMPVSVESKAQADIVRRLFGSRSRVCRVPARRK